MKLITGIIALASIVGGVTTYALTSSDKIEETNLDVVTNKNLNILISPDLSNRITKRYPKPLSDEVIISSLLDSYYPNIYKSMGRTIGQKDRLSILLTNPKLVNNYNIKMEQLEIDLSEMSDNERIVYLTDSTNAENTYHNDIKEFESEVKNVYKKATENSVGADIRNLLESQTNKSNVYEDADTIKAFGKTVVTINRNILILLTDGYMESGAKSKLSSGNKYYYLTQEVVNDFRKAFYKSGESDIYTFFAKNNYGIVPIKNSALKNLEVLAIEFYDRSLSKESGSSRVIPDDFEIMKLFWTDWMLKSGVKRFEVHENFSSISQSESVINSFIEGE